SLPAQAIGLSFDSCRRRRQIAAREEVVLVEAERDRDLPEPREVRRARTLEAAVGAEGDPDPPRDLLLRERVAALTGMFDLPLLLETVAHRVDALADRRSMRGLHQVREKATHRAQICRRTHDART